MGLVSETRSSEYRADIDGLRAIAVGLVIGFHYFPEAVPAGFIGVDVFFVISGFLITRLIANETSTNRFSLLSFYQRRVRRIFPALVTVLLACLAAGWFLLFPADYRGLATDIVWSTAFAANIQLYLQTGYFDSAAETKPLLHLWSLAIEEQFYVVWPLLLILLLRWRVALGGTLAVVALSFLFNIVIAATDEAAAFYLPLARLWELAAGALVAFTRPPQTYRHCNAVAYSGAVLLVVSVGLIDRTRAFPGWWALLPVLSTGLLILGGPTARLNTLLSNRALVTLGLISYPLYLWHWPMLVFTRNVRFGVEPTLVMKWVLIGGAVVLAYSTYRWIERPLRFGVASRLKPVGIATSLICVAAIALVVRELDGFPTRYSDQVQKLIRDFQGESSRAYRTGECFLSVSQSWSDFRPACIPKPTVGEPLVVLWGDSHAAHLFPGLAALQLDHGFSLAQLTTSGCPPIMAFASKQRPNCKEINEAVTRKITELAPRVVILAGRWDIYIGSRGWGNVEESAVRATISLLAASGVERIVVVGQFPVWSLPPSRILLRDAQLRRVTAREEVTSSEAEYNGTYLNSHVFAADDIVGRYWSADRVHLIYPRSTLCNLERCRVLVPGEPPQPMAWDESHLTGAGSTFFARSAAKQLLGPLSK